MESLNQRSDGIVLEKEWERDRERGIERDREREREIERGREKECIWERENELTL